MAKIFDSLNVYGTGTTSASTALNVFNSGSTNLLTVRNNGRVGIGTTSPEYVLDIISGNSRTYYDPSSAGGVFNISGSTNLPRFNVQTLTSGITPSISLGIRSYTDVVHPGYGKVGDSHIYSSAQSNGLNIISYLGLNTEDYIRFYAGQDANGTTPDLYINGSGTTRGYVGISNDSPTELLHLKSVESVRVKLEADTDNLDETHNSQLLLSQDGGGSTAVFGMTPDSINSLVIGVNSTSSLPNIHFGTRNDGTSFVTTADTKMIITNVGNVGIGTGSPNTKLEISSDNTSSVNNILRFTDTDGNVSANQMSGKIEFFTSESPGVGVRSYIAGVTDANANGSLIFATASGSSTSLTGGTTTGERMRINSSGNVGIGTTNPTEKLTVSGNTNITGTLSASSGNFVFDGSTLNLKKNNSGPNIIISDTGGTTTDSYIRFEATSAGTPSYAFGVDKGDTNKLKLTYANIGAATLSSTSYFEVSSGGLVNIPTSNVNNPMLSLGSSGVTFLVTGNSTRITSWDGTQKTRYSAFDQYSGYSAWNVNLNGAGGSAHFILNQTTSGTTVFGGKEKNDEVVIYHSGTTDVNTGYGMSIRGNLDVNGTVRIGTVTGSGAAVYRNATTGIIGILSSDERLKQNIEPITGATEIVKNLRGVYYNWKDNEDFQSGDDKKQFGLIAQEVEQILPEAVVLNGIKDYKTVKYSEMVSVLIQAFNEQQEVIEDLKIRISNLENGI